ncbi:MAG: hypothetical protein JNJ70_19560 [Verrucomicrobiales bacterium]|nr:hypothetical protein [Verrucomicrobiales bacterium]
MRIILTLSLLFLSISLVEAKAPSVKIYQVDKGSQGGLAVLDFFIRAESKNGIKKLEYRAAVDGKQSGWKKYPYYDGITNHLFFKVDCDVFTLWVRSIDKMGKKSKTVSKTFSGL